MHATQHASGGVLWPRHLRLAAAATATPPLVGASRGEVRGYLVERANVALVPGDAFGAPACLRISYAASLETLREAMDRLQAALDPGNFDGRVAERSGA